MFAVLGPVALQKDCIRKLNLVSPCDLGCQVLGVLPAFDTEPSLQSTSTDNVKRHSRSDSRQSGGGFRAVHSGASPNRQLGSGIRQPVILASIRNEDAFSNTNTESHVRRESTISGTKKDECWVSQNNVI